MAFRLLATLSSVVFFTSISTLAQAAQGERGERVGPLPSPSSPVLGTIETHLARSLTGAALLKRARAARGPLHKWVKMGAVSRTDAVLTRHLNLQTGQEVRERQVMIELKQDQKMDDILLDLAHELTHATIDPMWDPYDPGLKAKDYIRFSIERPGGEMDALMQECKVARELGLEPFEYRCGRYVSETTLSRHKMKQDFYRVGEWFEKLREQVGDIDGLPLSEERAELLSSTGKAPYPVSLFREYEALTESACQNSVKRLRSLAARERVPASQVQIHDRTQLFVKSRCKIQP